MKLADARAALDEAAAAVLRARYARSVANDLRILHGGPYVAAFAQAEQALAEAEVRTAEAHATYEAVLAQQETIR